VVGKKMMATMSPNKN